MWLYLTGETLRPKGNPRPLASEASASSYRLAPTEPRRVDLDPDMARARDDPAVGVTPRPGTDIASLPDPLPLPVVLADHRAGSSSLFVYPWCG